MFKVLLVTNDFTPIVSGISTAFYNLFRYIERKVDVDFEDISRIDRDLQLYINQIERKGVEQCKKH